MMRSDPSPDREQPKISILVPIYNSECDLQRCLESAREQTLVDIEILCVDDGSSDTSCQIVAELASQDARIRLFRHESNLGEGAARNTALDMARGDYIFHLDSDDTIPPDALTILHSYATAYNSEMVKGGMLIIDGDSVEKSADWTVPPEIEINTRLACSTFLQGVPTSHCTYLYKRAFVEEHRIRYPLDLAIGLDIVTLAEALIHAQRVTLVKDIVYRYHLSGSSVTRGGLTTEYVIDSIRAKERISDALSIGGFTEIAKSHLQQWGFIIGDLWMKMCRSLPPEDWTEIFSKFRTLTEKYEVIPWHDEVPLEHRYLLSLIMNRADERATAFIYSDAPFRGFSDSAEMEEGLNYILSTVPGDASTSFQLGCIKAQQNRLTEAVECFAEAARHPAYESESKLALTDALLKLDRLDEAKKTLDSLVSSGNQALPEKGVHRLWELQDQVSTAVARQSTQERLQLEKALAEARTEIESTRIALSLRISEIDSIKNSYSWRVTSPLRTATALLYKVLGKGS